MLTRIRLPALNVQFATVILLIIAKQIFFKAVFSAEAWAQVWIRGTQIPKQFFSESSHSLNLIPGYILLVKLLCFQYVTRACIFLVLYLGQFYADGRRSVMHVL